MAMSRPLLEKKRRCKVSRLSLNDGTYSWQKTTESVSARLPAQRRGVIIPMLSSTITAAALRSVCVCAIDPGVRNELTASFVKCRVDNNNTNSVRIDAFCHCFRHFGKATHTNESDSSRRVLAMLSTSSSSTSTTTSSLRIIFIFTFLLSFNCVCFFILFFQFQCCLFVCLLASHRCNEWCWAACERREHQRWRRRRNRQVIQALARQRAPSCILRCAQDDRRRERIDGDCRRAVQTARSMSSSSTAATLHDQQQTVRRRCAPLDICSDRAAWYFIFLLLSIVFYFSSLSLIFASCGLKEWDRDCTARSKCKVNARRRRRGSLLAVSLVAVISLCCSMNSIPAKYRLFFRLLFDLMFRFRFFFFSEITNWISSLLCIILFRFVHVALLSWSIRRYYTIYIYIFVLFHYFQNERDVFVFADNHIFVRCSMVCSGDRFATHQIV